MLALLNNDLYFKTPHKYICDIKYITYKIVKYISAKIYYKITKMSENLCIIQ